MHAIQNLIHKFFKYGIGGTGSKTDIPGKYVTNIAEMPPLHFFLAERLNFPIFMAPQYNAWGMVKLDEVQCWEGQNLGCCVFLAFSVHIYCISALHYLSAQH